MANTLTQREYVETAIRVIGTWGNSMMMRDDDAIGYVASFMMMADVNYDPNKNKTRSSWRLERAKFAIMNYKHRRMRYARYSLDHEKIVGGRALKFSDMIADERNSVESKTQLSEMVEIINVAGFLSERQKRCLVMHYVERKTYRVIGEELGISHQSVKLDVDLAVKRLREKYAS